MPAQLVALNDGPSILVDKPILMLGRHPECDIQIDSRKISRRHCCIAQVADYLVVRDLDSTNGIRINGVRIVEGKLCHGDELTIGNHRYRVVWDEGPVPARPAAQPASRPAGVVVPVEADEDEMLESCDEPVALPEPPRTPGQAPRLIPATARPNAGTDDESLIVPDNLELLPNSGSYPGQPPQPGTP
jgi:hypothetical protein